MSSLDIDGFPSTERFVLRRRIGAGGMGVVYEAYDQERRETVALKTMSHVDPYILYRFKREFRALADVSHRNLIRLHELISVEGQWFFTMELIDGVDFVTYVQGNELAWGRLRAAFRQLVEGVIALHDAGHMHRDIKPPNVLVTTDGRVVLLDFGLVTDIEPRSERRSTEDGLFGTPDYMAPEQAWSEPLTAAADWYSVGVLLYEVLTGDVPFAVDTPAGRLPTTPVERIRSDITQREGAPASPDGSAGSERRGWMDILSARQQSDTPPPSELVKGVPDDLDRICRGLLRRKPESRLTGQEVLQLLQKAPAGRMEDPAASAAAAPARAAAPFVGRASELAVLAEALKALRRGSPGTVFVRGISGMGKTALVRRFLDRLIDWDEVVLLEGRCYEQESVPYKALDSVVDRLSHYLAGLTEVEQAELMPRDVAALEQVFPVLGRVKAIAEAPRRLFEDQDPHTVRRKAFMALRELLARIGDRKPLIVFIDDLQWGDVDSAVVLSEILRPPEPPVLLLVTAYRSEDAERSPLVKRLLELQTQVAPVVGVRTVEVEALQPVETRELVCTLLATDCADVAEGVLEGIVRESGNHPYFVNELVRQRRTAAPTPRIGISLDQALTARLERLPEGARRLLDTVAVAGRPIQREVVFAAAAFEGGERAALDLLRDEHFVKTSGTWEAVYLEPFHDRIRETSLRQIAEPDRRVYHRRLAEALVARADADPEELAVHFGGAGDAERGGYYAKVAGDRAVAALAFDRAAMLYARSIELLRPEGADARNLRASLARALGNAGRGAEAAASYLQAAEGAEPRDALEYQRLAAEHLLASGHMDEGLDVARRVLALVHMRLPATPKGALVALLLKRALIRLRGLKFREHDLSTIPPRLLTIIDTCWSMALGLAVVDNIRGADFQARHLLLSLRAGEPYRVARALAMEAGFYAVHGGPTEARAARLTEEAFSLARKTGNQHALGLATTTAGMAAYLVGKWQRAYELCEQAIEILREHCVGVMWEMASAQRFMIASLLFLGEFREMRRRKQALLDEADRRGNLFAGTSLRTRMGHFLWLAADDVQSSRQEIDEAMSLWTSRGFHLQHYSALFGSAQTDIYDGDGAAALARLRENWQPLKRSLLPRVQVLKIEMQHLRARAALASLGEGNAPDGVLRQVERDAKGIERHHMTWADPLAALLRAGVAARRGEMERVVPLLSGAAKALDAADMALFAAATRRQWGMLVGGSEGQDLVSAAETWMSDQMIKNPARMSTMLVPGVLDNGCRRLAP